MDFSQHCFRWLFVALQWESITWNSLDWSFIRHLETLFNKFQSELKSFLYRNLLKNMIKIMFILFMLQCVETYIKNIYNKECIIILYIIPSWICLLWWNYQTDTLILCEYKADSHVSVQVCQMWQFRIDSSLGRITAITELSSNGFYAGICDTVALQDI